MIFVKVLNGAVDVYPYSIGQFKKDNKYTSFPKTISNNILEGYGIFPVVLSPVTTTKYQRIVRDNVPVLVDGVWTLNGVATDIDIEVAKKDAKAIIKEQRAKLLNAPLNGFQVATSEDRENISGAIEYYDTITSNGTVDLMWTMEDNTERVVTLTDLQGVRDGYVLRKAQIFANYQSKKQAVNSATTIAEIEAILGS